MTRESVAMCMCLTCVPVLVLTIAGVEPYALPGWLIGWLILLLTKEPTR